MSNVGSTGGDPSQNVDQTSKSTSTSQTTTTSNATTTTTAATLNAMMQEAGKNASQMASSIKASTSSTSQANSDAETSDVETSSQEETQEATTVGEDSGGSSGGNDTSDDAEVSSDDETSTTGSTSGSSTSTTSTTGTTSTTSTTSGGGPTPLEFKKEKRDIPTVQANTSNLVSGSIQNQEAKNLGVASANLNALSTEVSTVAPNLNLSPNTVATSSYFFSSAANAATKGDAEGAMVNASIAYRHVAEDLLSSPKGMQNALALSLPPEEVDAVMNALNGVASGKVTLPGNEVLSQVSAAISNNKEATGQGSTSGYTVAMILGQFSAAVSMNQVNMANFESTAAKISSNVASTSMEVGQGQLKNLLNDIQKQEHERHKSHFLGHLLGGLTIAATAIAIVALSAATICGGEEMAPATAIIIGMLVVSMGSQISAMSGGPNFQQEGMEQMALGICDLANDCGGHISKQNAMIVAEVVVAAAMVAAGNYESLAELFTEDAASTGAEVGSSATETTSTATGDTASTATEETAEETATTEEAATNKSLATTMVSTALKALPSISSDTAVIGLTALSMTGFWQDASAAIAEDAGADPETVMIVSMAFGLAGGLAAGGAGYASATKVSEAAQEGADITQTAGETTKSVTSTQIPQTEDVATTVKETAKGSIEMTEMSKTANKAIEDADLANAGGNAVKSSGDTGGTAQTTQQTAEQTENVDDVTTTTGNVAKTTDDVETTANTTGKVADTVDKTANVTAEESEAEAKVAGMSEKDINLLVQRGAVLSSMGVDAAKVVINIQLAKVMNAMKDISLDLAHTKSIMTTMNYTTQMMNDLTSQVVSDYSNEVKALSQSQSACLQSESKGMQALADILSGGRGAA